VREGRAEGRREGVGRGREGRKLNTFHGLLVNTLSSFPPSILPSPSRVLFLSFLFLGLLSSPFDNFLHFLDFNVPFFIFNLLVHLEKVRREEREQGARVQGRRKAGRRQGRQGGRKTREVKKEGKSGKKGQGEKEGKERR
jgi:hypothetical protein